MTTPTETIHHDGESFQIYYEAFLECGECPTSWDVTDRADGSEDDTPPSGDTTCPACGATHGHAYVRRAHYYLKYSAGPLADPPPDVGPHAAALRRLAREFEALEANGWELVESDGVHLDFEKTVIESIPSDHKVTDTLT